jgi:hypothetical protein
MRISLLLVVLLSGCFASAHYASQQQGLLDAIQSRAATELPCAHHAIRIVEVGGCSGNYDCSIYAVGCDRTAVYYEGEGGKIERQGDVMNGVPEFLR